MDWKDMLGKLREDPDLPPGDDTPEETTRAQETPKKKDKLHVVTEKKGRKGKTATIIEGFTCNDEELSDIAGKLKKKLGVGGSARGGEILIQGDLRERVVEELRALGYKI